MRQFNKFRGTKGWLSTYESTVRFRYMRNKKEVERRVKILSFWATHGTAATKDAFSVSRRTLFRWRRALGAAHGKLPALDPQSTAPTRRRKRRYDATYLDRVMALRKEHRHLGKKKIALLLGVSESYAGRTLTDLKKRDLLPAYRKVSVSRKTGRMIERTGIRRTKARRTDKRGMELDTVVRFIDGTRRYVLTAIDVECRFAFAGAYTTHSSASAADFLLKLRSVAPFPIRALQTDNGSEFDHHFRDACRSLAITQYHTYPRTPKMNAHIERFNRTLSEDCIMRHRELLRDDLPAFNDWLVDWLLWYNCERPHQSLSMLSPMQYIVSTLSSAECQRCWTSTNYCNQDGSYDIIPGCYIYSFIKN